MRLNTAHIVRLFGNSMYTPGEYGYWKFRESINTSHLETNQAILLRSGASRAWAGSKD